MELFPSLRLPNIWAIFMYFLPYLRGPFRICILTLVSSYSRLMLTLYTHLHFLNLTRCFTCPHGQYASLAPLYSNITSFNRSYTRVSEPQPKSRSVQILSVVFHRLEVCSLQLYTSNCPRYWCILWFLSLTTSSHRFIDDLASPVGGATTTSSQIYLSRGVAGTKSTPALPYIDRSPASVASYFESPHRHSLSLSPPPTPSSAGVVSRLSEPANRTQMNSRESPDEAISTEYSPAEPETSVSSHTEASSSHTKRSDVLRHVFPRSHVVRNSSVASGITSRMVKLSHKSSPPLSSARHSKPRVAFHRALTSFFNTNPTAITTPIPHDPNTSASASIRSRANSNSLHGSIPSLEFVSSGAFIFSGPSLKSRSGSFNNSTPRLPSLREDSEEFNILRRVHSDTFSFDDMVVSQPIYRGRYPALIMFRSSRNSKTIS